MSKLKDNSTGLIIYTLLGVMGVFLLPYASTSKENAFKVISTSSKLWVAVGINRNNISPLGITG